MSKDIGVWLQVICTIGVLTYLYKENWFWRIFEYSIVAGFTGYSLAYGYHNYIKPFIGEKMLKEGQWSFLIPLILGILLYTRFIPGWGWLGRYAMAYMIGYGAGYTLGFDIKPLLGQIRASFVSLTSFNNIVLWLFVVTSLAYFFFTVSKETPVMKGLSTVGKWAIMIALGASFGNTILYRYNLLYPRMKLIFNTWLGLGG